MRNSKEIPKCPDFQSERSRVARFPRDPGYEDGLNERVLPQIIFVFLKPIKVSRVACFVKTRVTRLPRAHFHTVEIGVAEGRASIYLRQLVPLTMLEGRGG